MRNRTSRDELLWRPDRPLVVTAERALGPPADRWVDICSISGRFNTCDVWVSGDVAWRDVTLRLLTIHADCVVQAEEVEIGQARGLSFVGFDPAAPAVGDVAGCIMSARGRPADAYQLQARSLTASLDRAHFELDARWEPGAWVSDMQGRQPVGLFAPAHGQIHEADIFMGPGVAPIPTFPAVPGRRYAITHFSVSAAGNVQFFLRTTVSATDLVNGRLVSGASYVSNWTYPLRSLMGEGLELNLSAAVNCWYNITGYLE